MIKIVASLVDSIYRNGERCFEYLFAVILGKILFIENLKQIYEEKMTRERKVNNIIARDRPCGNYW